MNTDDILIESSKKTGQVFLNSETICLWDEIITGSYILRDDRLKNKMKAVAPNTARAFHKINKNNQLL
jgi:hypothetical protein